MADLRQPLPTEIVIATNNGDIGGGEVMLFNIAQMLEKLGRKVVVLAPSTPDKVALKAQALGLNTIVLEAETRLDWLFAIRKWRRQNKGSLIWCNGLLPAFATSLQGNRIVHLHQRPAGLLKIAAFLARLNRPLTVVPSRFMSEAVTGSKLLYNWVDEPQVLKKHNFDSKILRVGFIGRLSVDKGITTLCEAINLLNQADGGISFELIVAGESRFASTSDARVIEAALASISGKVTLIGWVAPSALFEQIDVLVVPSNEVESFGLVLSEAMAAKISFICSDSGALPEVAGFDYPLIFRAGDSEALAKCLEQFASDLAEQPASLQNLVSNEKNRWRAQFSPESAEQNLAGLLKENNL